MIDVPTPARACMSFPKSSRILKKMEYKRVLENGAKVVCHEMVVFAIQSQSPRLGLVVSRKVGNAVTRNRVKRILREAFRQEINFVRLDLDIVVIARLSAATADFKRVSRSLIRSLERLGKKLGQNNPIESKVRL